MAPERVQSGIAGNNFNPGFGGRVRSNTEAVSWRTDLKNPLRLTPAPLPWEVAAPDFSAIRTGSCSDNAHRSQAAPPRSVFLRFRDASPLQPPPRQRRRRKSRPTVLLPSPGGGP